MMKFLTVAMGIYFLYRLIIPRKQLTWRHQKKANDTPVIDIDYEEVDDRSD
ncbi:MAG: hypothetical protein AAFR14_05330 [Bacteroidota bacterium]